MKKVDRYTRAVNDGKLIQCPECGEQSRVYHFAWAGLACQGCSAMVDKGEWLIVEEKS